MPRKIRRTSRRRTIHRWVKKQRGGFVLSLAAIGSAIAAAVSAAAPAVATSVASAAAGYATTKLLQKVGGSRRRRTIRRR
jgi:hypothetical protein